MLDILVGYRKYDRGFESVSCFIQELACELAGGLYAMFE